MLALCVAFFCSLPKAVNLEAARIDILHGDMTDTEQQNLVDRFLQPLQCFNSLRENNKAVGGVGRLPIKLWALEILNHPLKLAKFIVVYFA